MQKLNAESLKQVLWQTMHDLREGRITPDKAHAIASQAREILRTVKIQISISKNSNKLKTFQITNNKG